MADIPIPATVSKSLLRLTEDVADALNSVGVERGQYVVAVVTDTSGELFVVGGVGLPDDIKRDLLANAARNLANG